MKSAVGRKGDWIFTDKTGYNEVLALNINPEIVRHYQHFNLNRGGEFILPKSRKNSLHDMYLIRF